MNNEVKKAIGDSAFQEIDKIVSVYGKSFSDLPKKERHMLIAVFVGGAKIATMAIKNLEAKEEV